MEGEIVQELNQEVKQQDKTKKVFMGLGVLVVILIILNAIYTYVVHQKLLKYQEESLHLYARVLVLENKNSTSANSTLENKLKEQNTNLNELQKQSDNNTIAISMLIGDIEYIKYLLGIRN